MKAIPGLQFFPAQSMILNLSQVNPQRCTVQLLRPHFTAQPIMGIPGPKLHPVFPVWPPEWLLGLPRTTAIMFTYWQGLQQGLIILRGFFAHLIVG